MNESVFIHFADSAYYATASNVNVIDWFSTVAVVGLNFCFGIMLKIVLDEASEPSFFTRSLTVKESEHVELKAKDEPAHILATRFANGELTSREYTEAMARL
jgi:hypothetical protein